MKQTQTPEVKNYAALKFGGGNVILTARLNGSTDSFIKGMTNYKFAISISIDSGNKESFVYHTSAKDFEDNKNYMTSDDLICALDAILRDGMAGNMDFEEFCNEFGYDEDSREAYSTWESCKEMSEQLENLFQDIETASLEFGKVYGDKC